MSARRRSPARWRARSTAPSRASSSRPTCCRATSPASASSTSARASSRSGPGRCSPTSCSPTSSTARPRARSRRCSSACRSGRSRSTAWRGPLAAPFFVIATQNPIEQDGTFPLPEAQLDRFALRLALGYPEPGAEARMLADQTAPEGSPLETLDGGRRRRRAGRRGARLPHRARRAVAARLRRRALRGDPGGRPPRARREPARGRDARAAGARPRARARARSRPARRRQGAGARRARAPPAARRRRAGRRRARSSTRCSRGCPCRCERRGGPVR